MDLYKTSLNNLISYTNFNDSFMKLYRKDQKLNFVENHDDLNTIWNTELHSREQIFKDLVMSGLWFVASVYYDNKKLYKMKMNVSDVLSSLTLKLFMMYKNNNFNETSDDYDLKYFIDEYLETESDGNLFGTPNCKYSTYFMGLFFENGWGCKKNIGTAFKYYGKAIEQGFNPMILTKLSIKWCNWTRSKNLCYPKYIRNKVFVLYMCKKKVGKDCTLLIIKHYVNRAIKN